MKFLRKLDKGFAAFAKYFTGALVLLMAAIVCAMVFSRYVLRVNLGGFEELPAYILCWCVWLGAIMIARSDEHMKVEKLFMLVKNEKAQVLIKALTSLLSTVVLAYFITRSGRFVSSAFTHSDITPALGWPSWAVYIVSIVGSVGMTIYTAVNTVKYFRRLKDL